MIYNTWWLEFHAHWSESQASAAMQLKSGKPRTNQLIFVSSFSLSSALGGKERERELVSLTLALLTGRRREILVKRMLDWCLKHTDTVAVFFFLWHYLRLIYVSSLIFVLSLPPLLIVSYQKSAVISRVLQMEMLKGAELTRNLWTTKLGKK